MLQAPIVSGLIYQTKKQSAKVRVTHMSPVQMGSHGADESCLGGSRWMPQRKVSLDCPPTRDALTLTTGPVGDGLNSTRPRRPPELNTAVSVVPKLPSAAEGQCAKREAPAVSLSCPN